MQIKGILHLSSWYIFVGHICCGSFLHIFDILGLWQHFCKLLFLMTLLKLSHGIIYSKICKRCSEQPILKIVVLVNVFLLQIDVMDHFFWIVFLDHFFCKFCIMPLRPKYWIFLIINVNHPLCHLMRQLSLTTRSTWLTMHIKRNLVHTSIRFTDTSQNPGTDPILCLSCFEMQTYSAKHYLRHNEPKGCMLWPK